MTVLPVDLTSLVASVMALLLLLLPVAGLSMRLALKPIVEAIVKTRQNQLAGKELELLEKRVSLLEQQQDNLEIHLEQLSTGVQGGNSLPAGDADRPMLEPDHPGQRPRFEEGPG